jgi:5-methylcytosine-specific restriction endonuclease McrA
MKRCTRCGETKPLSEFHRNRKYFVSECKSCKSIRSKENYKNNSFVRRLASFVRHQLNRKNNLSAMKQRHARRTEEELENDRVRLREWHRLHRAEDRENNRKYHKAHPEKARDRVRKRRSILNGLEGSFTDEEFSQLVLRCGGECLACGKETKLHADHVVPISRGGRNSIDNIQPLCKSCNSSKHDKTIDYRGKFQT